jgi:hypothetical protein
MSSPSLHPSRSLHPSTSALQVVKKAKLTKLVFNPKWPILLVGDDKGCVTSLKLSPNLRKRCVPDKGQKVSEWMDGCVTACRVQAVDTLLVRAARWDACELCVPCSVAGMHCPSLTNTQHGLQETAEELEVAKLDKVLLVATKSDPEVMQAQAATLLLNTGTLGSTGNSTGSGMATATAVATA